MAQNRYKLWKFICFFLQGSWGSTTYFLQCWFCWGKKTALKEMIRGKRAASEKCHWTKISWNLRWDAMPASWGIKLALDLTAFYAVHSISWVSRQSKHAAILSRTLSFVLFHKTKFQIFRKQCLISIVVRERKGKGLFLDWFHMIYFGVSKIQRYIVFFFWLMRHSLQWPRVFWDILYAGCCAIMTCAGTFSFLRGADPIIWQMPGLPQIVSNKQFEHGSWVIW